MSISASALLVELNISVWTAAKKDNTTTSNVLASNNTGGEAGSFRKNLLAGTSLRKDISDYAAATRLYHHKVTLPWQDRGGRLLPTAMFMEYKQQMNVRKAYHDILVQRLLDNYDSIKQTAQNYLQGMYKEEDYPSVDEIQDKFGFNLVFSPLPESGDFRLDVPSADLAEIAQQYEQNFNDRLVGAMRKPWEDLHELLSSMSAKLVESGEEEKRKWHDTFVTNAQGMCKLLTSLNINNDPKLEEARRGLESAMLGADIEAIKEDGLVRSELKGKIDSILDKFNW